MNNRIRQICKEQLKLLEKDGEVLCTLVRDDSRFLDLIFVKRDKLEAVKAEYGDALDVLDWLDEKGGKE